LTPNRADALSMVGAAYETSALYGAPLTLPETQPDTTETSASEEISVTVENPDKTPYYSARVVKNVKIGPSPMWMQARLMKA
ncbi:hypothetical protein NL518_29470, partial [Klebsiella pneumoniae]|nr:hypothetical protein [Klebsiella pneumoniae]